MVSETVQSRTARFFESVVSGMLALLGTSIFIAGIVVLGGFWLVLYQQSAALKDYAQLAAASMTFLASAAAAAFAARAAKQQRDLERLKVDLAAQLEGVKASLTQNIEAVKARLAELAPRQHEAYHALWAATDKYYRALSDLEVGEYSEEKLGAAHAACEEAAGKSLLVDLQHMEEFHSYWNSAQRINDLAKQIRADSVAMKALWANEVKQLAKQYYEIREEFAKRLCAT